MIAVDTNILVHAHRRDSAWHRPAAERMRELAEGSSSWGMPWPCVHEFLAIATHPRIYVPPSTNEQATKQINAWLDSPTVVMLAEAPGYWELLRRLLQQSKVTGPRVHDARIAALCMLHGVRELWTADRDFGAFPDLATRNPLVMS
ncbi:MAG: TA system VapC family ribonuclease toxin [Pseudomonadota bacterium]